MGLSFRKSVQILPGIKLNISNSGIGVSAGVSGLHASINSKGQLRGTASIPGTGIRYTKSTKLSNLIPGAKEREEAKKAAEKQAKAEAAAAKKAEAAEKKRAEAAEKKAAADAQKAEKAQEQQAEKEAKLKKNELAQAIIDIYAIADKSIDWVSIKNSTVNLGYENWEYLKQRAGKVLDGDIDTYLELISDVNPFAELIELGSDFECGTDSPMKMTVLCTVNADKVLGESRDDKDLLEDYVAGTAIKSARDLFALLPLWQIEITCVESERTVLNVKFTRDSFEELNFAKLDASDTVRKLGGIIAV